MPFRFTGKELDEETGFYYYGARYLNPKTSAWISADPALGDYMPVAPISDDAKNHNQKLLGPGGVFNLVNLNLYHYAGNNPIRYVDPDGLLQAVCDDVRGDTITYNNSCNKTDISIIITRHVNPNDYQTGKAKAYYQDSISVLKGSRILLTFSIQASASAKGPTAYGVKVENIKKANIMVHWS